MKRVLLYALLTLLFLPFTVTLIFRTPLVQTQATRMFLNWITSRTEYQVTVGKLYFSLFSGMELEHVTVLTPEQDTILTARQIAVSPSFSHLLQRKLQLNHVRLRDVDFRLVWQKGADDYDFMRFISSFNRADTVSGGAKASFALRINHISIENGRFLYRLDGVKPLEGMRFNPAEINTRHVFIKAHDFTMVDDSLHFYLDMLRGDEQCGLSIKKMTSVVTICNHALSLEKASLVTPLSLLNFDYSMQTASWSSYGNFYDSVRLSVSLRSSMLDVSELGYFSTNLFSFKDKIMIEGKASGPLSHINADRLRIKYGENTDLQVSGLIRGLPEFNTLQANLHIHQFTTSANDLSALKLPGVKIDAHRMIPDNLPLQLSGTFNGSVTDFVADLKAGHRSDNLSLKLHMRHHPNGYDLKGTVTTTSLHPGYYYNMPHTPGKTKFGLNFKASLNDAMNKIVFDVKGSIPLLRVQGVELNNILLESHFADDTLTTGLAVGDKALLAVANGRVVLGNVPALDYTIQLKNADFKKLNITPSRKVRLSSNIHLTIKDFDLDKMMATLHMSDSKIWFGDEWYRLKTIDLNKTVTENGQYALEITSDFADLNLTGNDTLSTLSDNLEGWYAYYFDKKNHQVQGKGEASLYLLLKNPSIIGEQFVRGLDMAPGTELNASLNFADNTLTAQGHSEKITFADVDFKNVAISAAPFNSGIKAALDVQSVVIKDSTSGDTTMFGMDRFRLAALLFPDSLNYSVVWKNNDTLKKNYADIRGVFSESHNNKRMAIYKGEVYINDMLWSITPGNYILSDSTGTTIHDFHIFRGRSEITVSGQLPETERDTLKVFFKQWDLSNFDLLYHLWNFDLDGIIDGDLRYSSGFNRFWFVSDLKIKELKLNKILLGDARILNTWDNANSSIFFKSQIVRKGNSGKGKVFALDGFLYPFSKTQNFNVKASFNRMKIKAFEPFMDEYVSRLEGKAEGDILLTGTFDKPVLKGWVEFNRTALRINYLNTKYSFSNRIVFDENKIDFGKLILYDTLGNHATLTGGLVHDYFHDFRFDLTIHTAKFLFFDTNRNQNELYYGEAIASGDIYIKGSPDDISVKIDASSADGTSVTIPLDYTTEILDKDYIVFVSPPTDSVEADTVQMKKVLNKNSRYDIQLNMKVEPNADVQILLPYEMGSIKSKGNGTLRLKTNSEGLFSLVGDYVVHSGEFNFNIQNLVSKRFLLLEGGKISWNGDPYAANMNIVGLYTVKTNYSSLGFIVDSTATYKNRLNVNCYIKLTGSLEEPDMRFEIKFPDLDPDMQRMVYAQLDTTNQALVNQQMISLLVLGTFSFSNASNVSLSSSYYSIISNQLSGLLSRVSKDIDIGINYKPGDNISQEEFEVALSTQLFDNRLIINGNFGMTYDRSNNTASNIVGDVDVDFKLTRDGRWRLKAYNHSNVNSWYYYNNYDKVSPYTQGVGIAYQKEFNTLSELFQNNRKRYKKRKKHGNKASAEPKK